MPTLKGVRLAVLETRLSTELSELIRRFGGVPCAVPSVREVSHLEHVPAFLDALCAGRFSVAICLTGVGVSRLLREAERLGRLDETLIALRRLTIACRGPKPSAVLRQYDVPVHIRPAEPFTTKELLEALNAVDLQGTRVALLHYGERNLPLADALRARGAVLEELCLYEWELPDDVEPLKALVRNLVDGQMEAIAFTSQIQCRHLFDVAANLGLASALVDAMRGDVIVAAIGPVCASALNAYGITPDVLPAHPKMGALITAVADYIELRDEPSSET
jgi:uroporphyrinogen-III synthase